MKTNETATRVPGPGVQQSRQHERDDAMVFQICPFHTLEEVPGTWVSDDVGWKFTCPLSDHVPPGPYTWLSPPPPPKTGELSGIAEELGLGVELPAVLKAYAGTWVEYGIVERAYALANPKDWQFLLERYGHRAITPSKYTVSAFLAATLGNLQRTGTVAFHAGPATGRWSYNGTISWWTLPPEPAWANRLAWENSGLSLDYIPGHTEQT